MSMSRFGISISMPGPSAAGALLPDHVLAHVAPPTEPPPYAPYGYAAPPVPQPVPVQYAGFWRRFWALFLDGIIMNIIMFPIQLMIGVPMMWTSFSEDDLTPERFMTILSSYLALFFFSSLVQWIYFGFLESSGRQATLGKMALGIKVTDLQGRRISFARASGRYFARWITALTLLIGYLIQLFTARRQTLHDLIASTLVTRSEA